MTFFDDYNEYENNLEKKIIKKLREFDNNMQKLIQQKTQYPDKIIFNYIEENQEEKEREDYGLLSTYNRTKDSSYNPEYHKRIIFEEIESSHNLTKIILKSNIYFQKRTKKINNDKRNNKNLTCFNQKAIFLKKIDEIKVDISKNSINSLLDLNQQMQVTIINNPCRFFKYQTEENLIKKIIFNRINEKILLKLKIKDHKRREKSIESQDPFQVISNLTNQIVNKDTEIKNPLNKLELNNNIIKQSQFGNEIIAQHERNRSLNSNQSIKSNKSGILENNTSSYINSNNNTSLINLNRDKEKSSYKNILNLVPVKSSKPFNDKINKKLENYKAFGYFKDNYDLEELKQKANIKEKMKKFDPSSIFNHVIKNKFLSSKAKLLTNKYIKSNFESLEQESEFIRKIETMGCNENQIRTIKRGKTQIEIKVARNVLPKIKKIN